MWQRATGSSSKQHPTKRRHIILEIIIIVVLLVLAGFGIFYARKFRAKITAGNAQESSDQFSRRYDPSDDTIAKRVWTGVTAGAVLIALVVGGFSTIYTQNVGEAKVILNADGTIAGEKLDPGFGFKAPWQSFVDYDLFSQEVLYAGSGEGVTPVYSGGIVNGAEITTTVKGVNGGSTQGNLDISITYSIDADKVTELYQKYRTQERFTKQVIEKTILATIREVSPNYTAIDFRGGERGAATDSILKSLNEKLNGLGVTVDFVNLQDVRYSPEVEDALKQVEVANQNVLKQEADLRATEISAQQKVVQAQAEADANALLNASLTPEILQQRYIDALGEGTVYVVPAGSTPFITAK